MPTKKTLKIIGAVLALVLLASCGNDTGHYYPKQSNSMNYYPDINDLFAQYFEKMVALDPQFVTSQGYSQHITPGQEDKLTPISFGYQEWKIELAKNTLEVLAQYSDADLTPEQKVNKAILEWTLEHTIAGEEFTYHNTTQLTKVQELTYFMQRKHAIETVEDANNYLARLEQFPVVFKQLRSNLEIQKEKGYVAPVGLLDTLFHGLVDLERPVNQFSRDFEAKVEKLEEKDELVKRCQKILKDSVSPAAAELKSQISDIRSTDIQNLCDLPNGKEYYAWLLRGHTTSNMTPEDVHQLALAEVARLQEEIEELIFTLGYDGSSPSQVLADLRSQDLIPQEEVLAYYNELIEVAEEFLPQFFGRLPETPVEVRGVDYFATGYYPPTREGSTPGIFVFYLAGNHPIIDAKWLTWHEAIPGHHMQFAIEHEADIPYFRDLSTFTGYLEGWATYAEMLFYEFDLVDDPAGYLSNLDRYLMLAARTVMETGLNYLGWSKQQAIDYLDEVAGEAWGSASWASDVVARPGRAVSYFVGMMKIRELRAKAENELGETFDIREFHDLILQFGSIPLVVLEELVDQYIESNN